MHGPISGDLDGWNHCHLPSCNINSKGVYLGERVDCLGKFVDGGEYAATYDQRRKTIEVVEK